MTPVEVAVRRLPHAADLPLPRYATAQSAGMDLLAALEDAVVLAPGERRLIPSGLAIALPAGYEAQVRPRSGLALKHGVTCLNTPGLIDAGYRGELAVLLVNTDPSEPFTVARGDRIAQLVIQQVEQAAFVEVDSLDDPDRGEGGWGHTG